MAGVADPDAPVVALPNDPAAVVLGWDPKSPPDGRGCCCWFEAWFPEPPKLKGLPPKPPPLVGWFAPLVFIVANGFEVDGPEPNDDEKLKDEGPPPDPKANGDAPF